MSRFTDYRIVPAEPAHIPGLARGLREMDRRELKAQSGQEPAGREPAGREPEEALGRSLSASERAWTALTGEGEVIMLWGVARLGGLLGFTGCPWMLGTELLNRPDIRREFIRRSRAAARALEEGFDRLENYVLAENRLAIRWLSWLGFSFDEGTVRLGGENFRRFRKELAHV